MHDEAALDVVRAEPLCAETPTRLLAAPITPAASVYVRSNFALPPLDAAHVIDIGGAVRAPFTVSLPELAALPRRHVTVTIECAGNGRLGMDPLPTGEPWRYGAVSTTTWSGVSLRTLLERAGLAPDVVEILGIGADAGPRDDADGDVRFARSLPIADAMHPDTIVATHMAGEPLSYDHGAPVRLIVPGWYGMASVKWLARLEAITTPFTGYFQQQRYVYEVEDTVEPVRRARVKSMITSPVDGGRCDREVLVQGWAWSGAGAIARVELAVNEAPIWIEAALGTPVSAYAWTPFEAELVLPDAGAATIRSRATDMAGNVQPERIQWNRLGYGNNAIRRIAVDVADEVR
ncbi:sulfite oxidase [Gemmatimonas groenlandica]|uniref:sulfite oxidase n=1 Tax=Gemmatimonas groenlandica TaxID=2732249 RepID=UPI00197F9300|nr:sulfite oxidase [Gemmatimonas groenlandica]